MVSLGLELETSCIKITVLTTRPNYLLFYLSKDDINHIYYISYFNRVGLTCGLDLKILDPFKKNKKYILTQPLTPPNLTCAQYEKYLTTH